MRTDGARPNLFSERESRRLFVTQRFALFHQADCSNMLERFDEELRRRTRVVRNFPNPASCLRLVRAWCAEKHETWLESQPSSSNPSPPQNRVCVAVIIAMRNPR